MPCMLVAHNCKSFDAKFLVQAAEKNGFIDDLDQTVSGFTDSLPAFRELLPERKSHSQENLLQDLLCKFYEAHNAHADVQTLNQLVNKMSNCYKHSFRVLWVASYQKLLKEKKLLVNTLQPLAKEKCMSTSMAGWFGLVGLVANKNANNNSERVYMNIMKFHSVKQMTRGLT